MPTPLVRWTIPATWTPDPATYTALTRNLTFLMPASTAASTLTAMAVAQMQLCDAQNPSTLGTPFIDADQNDYDRNGKVI